MKLIDKPMPRRISHSGLNDPLGLIAIITKNQPGRLGLTLNQFVNCEFDVVVIDDSTSRASKNLFESKYNTGKIRYHGKDEQKDILSSLQGTSFTEFIPRLGLPGWTLGLSRNYAVLLASYYGYEYLLMIDDDIKIEQRNTIRVSFDMLRHHHVVGARTRGMPDDSIVGHLFRSVGIRQYDFITGQYMGINLRRVLYFFPNVYNEDLIFVMFQGLSGRLARSGSVRQLTSNRMPNTKARLVFQEFGEILLEGLASLQRSEQSLLLVKAFWEKIIKQRALELTILEDRLNREKSTNTKWIRILRNYHRSIKLNNLTNFYSRYLTMVPKWQEIMSEVRGLGGKGRVSDQEPNKQ